MDKLPPEILHPIFIKLDRREQFICALVSRSWWRVLNRTCLHKDVSIDSHVRNFIKFMRMIKQSPHRAPRVQKLNLYDSLAKGFNKRKICKIFPNARVIRVDDAEDNPAEIENYSEQLDMTHLKSTVEELHDGGYCGLTIQIINSNLCGRLHSLHLNFEGLDTESSNIIRQLKNMPVWKNFVYSR